MAVGVAHVGLHSGDQAVGDPAYDTEEQAEAHASAGEEEGGEEHAHRGSDKWRWRFGMKARCRASPLRYINPTRRQARRPAPSRGEI